MVRAIWLTCAEIIVNKSQCDIARPYAIKKAPNGCLKFWSRGPDLNRRPPGYEPGELPDCSTPQYVMPCKAKSYITRTVKVLQAFNPLTACLSLFLHKWISYARTTSNRLRQPCTRYSSSFKGPSRNMLCVDWKSILPVAASRVVCQV